MVVGNEVRDDIMRDKGDVTSRNKYLKPSIIVRFMDGSLYAMTNMCF